MSGMRGGQIDAMRELGRKFDEHAGTIQGLIKALNASTSSSHDIWTGPAADRFRGDWESFKPTLDKLVNSLHDAGKAVKVNADNI